MGKIYDLLTSQKKKHNNQLRAVSVVKSVKILLSAIDMAIYLVQRPVAQSIVPFSAKHV